MTIRCIALAIGLAAMLGASAQAADDAQIARGKYLATIGACNDCHTPGTLLGHPDMARFLGGSDVGFAIPELGVFVGPNLTPDPETGLGKWTVAEMITAITKGERPDGRRLAPIMPWRYFAELTQEDATALVMFLRSLPPVRHQVPGPFGAKAAPSVPVMAVLPCAVYARTADLPATECGK